MTRPPGRLHKGLGVSGRGKRRRRSPVRKRRTTTRDKTRGLCWERVRERASASASALCALLCPVDRISGFRRSEGGQDVVVGEFGSFGHHRSHVVRCRQFSGSFDQAANWQAQAPRS